MDLVKSFLNKLFDVKKTRPKEVVSKIKNGLGFSELCSIADLVESKHKRISDYLYGNPLPKSLDSLGFVDGRFWLPISNSLIQEINWTLLAVRRFKSQLSLFVEYKKIFDDSIIVGDYANADRYLTKIEEELCYSVWGVQSRMTLLEAFKSPEENKLYLSKFN